MARHASSRAGHGLVALGATLALLPVAVGWAHAALVKSIPARRATVTRAPDRVQLWFNEQLESQFARCSVWDRHGTQVDLRDARVDPDDPKQLSVGLPPLGPGAYTVKFRVLSVDGHVVGSEYAFTIRRGP